MGFWNWLEEVSQAGLLHDLNIDLRAVALQIVVIIIMFKAIKMIYFKPLKEALDGRTKYIEDTYASADNLKAEMETLRTEYQEKLSAAEAESREKIQAAIGEAQSLKDKLVGEARKQADDIKQRATADMNMERERMMVELRTRVVDLALTAAEKVTRETMTDDRHRKLVAAFVEESGAA
jgi:F-type H+-transporting ATPase subunit b